MSNKKTEASEIGNFGGVGIGQEDRPAMQSPMTPDGGFEGFEKAVDFGIPGENNIEVTEAKPVEPSNLGDETELKSNNSGSGPTLEFPEVEKAMTEEAFPAISAALNDSEYPTVEKVLASDDEHGRVQQWLKDNEIDAGSISFYQGLDEHGDIEDRPDSNFGTCEITGEKGSCGDCVARNNRDELVEFSVSDHLIGGALGKMAGAF